MDKEIVREDGSVIVLKQVDEYSYLAYVNGKLLNWNEVFQSQMVRGQEGNAAVC